MEKKLRLDLDALQVESFVTTPEMGGKRGTVFAQTGATDGNTCQLGGGGQCSQVDCSEAYSECGASVCYGTCGGNNTCAINCNNTAGNCGSMAFCGSEFVTCDCMASGPACPTAWIIGWEPNTCNPTCNCGITYTCDTDEATCPGLCETFSQPNSACTDEGCTACGAMC